MTIAADSSGNSNDGTYQGTCSGGSPVVPTEDDCSLHLAGAGWVEANAVVGDVTGADPVTFGLWYRPNAAGTVLAFNTNQPPLNDNRTATSWFSDRFRLNVPTPGDVPQVVDTPSSYPADGSAYLIAFEAGTAAQKIYVNGSLAATGSHTGTKLPVQSTDRFSIGQEFDAGPSELGFGDYGHAFVFAGALTALQHAALYAAGATGATFPADLLALGPEGYWLLDEFPCQGWIIGAVQVGTLVTQGWQ